MSAKDHKALVKAVATKLCHYPRGPNCFNSCCSTPMGQKRCQNIARAVLALIARTLETVTPEMRDAIWDTRKTFEEAWRNTIAASPLSPALDAARKAPQ